jgi:predicted ATPase
MKEQLEIRNFGPIEYVKLDLCKITVFIGEQGSGKSCISKLISVLRNIDLFNWNNELQGISEVYNIQSFFKTNTYISYSSLDYDVIFDNDKTIINKHDTAIVKATELIFNELVGIAKKIKPSEWESESPEIELVKMKLNEINNYNDIMTKSPVYIPAERILIPSISNVLFGLTNSQVALPKCLINFGNLFENARNHFITRHFDFFNITYNYSNNMDTVILENSKVINLREASSGIQASLPMLLVILHRSIRKTLPTTFIVEEPELNLYPTTQKHLTYFLLKHCTSDANELIITTHSPYILESFNVALQAYKTFEINNKLSEKIQSIIDKDSWINPAEFNIYCLKGGFANQLFDETSGLIHVRDLDDFSRLIDGDCEHLQALARGE